MLNRYDFASSRFGISGPNTSRNDKNIPCSPHFHLPWQFCRTMITFPINAYNAYDKFGLMNHLSKVAQGSSWLNYSHLAYEINIKFGKKNRRLEHNTLLSWGKGHTGLIAG